MHKKQFVLIIPDGAGDQHRSAGFSPMAAARTPNTDFLARSGVTGLMQTLYPDLPRGSLVAQLGMFGWDPRLFYPHGRSSCELLGKTGMVLEPSDVAFRVNFVYIEDSILKSFNANYISTTEAEVLVGKINEQTRENFDEFILYHNADFRNTLVIRNASVDPRCLICIEPHENEGLEMDLAEIVETNNIDFKPFVERINSYLKEAGRVLKGETANMLMPWSASRAFSLPPFEQVSGFSGRVGVIGAMDFLSGIAKAGGIDFFRIGNGRWDTDYAAKGRELIRLLGMGYEVVICHINGPDEAAHIGDETLKIDCLEKIDYHIVGPVVDYFSRHPGALGGVMVAPDHYTNCQRAASPGGRSFAHSLDPTPFVLWNGLEVDPVQTLSEDQAALGKYGGTPVSHLRLMEILGVSQKVGSAEGAS